MISPQTIDEARAHIGRRIIISDSHGIRSGVLRHVHKLDDGGHVAVETGSKYGIELVDFRFIRLCGRGVR